MIEHIVILRLCERVFAEVAQKRSLTRNLLDLDNQKITR